jgi:hypothetical protein
MLGLIVGKSGFIVVGESEIYIAQSNKIKKLW